MVDVLIIWFYHPVVIKPGPARFGSRIRYLICQTRTKDEINDKMVDFCSRQEYREDTLREFE